MVAMYLDGGFLSPLTLKEDDKLLSLIPEDRPRDKLDMTNRSVADLALKPLVPSEKRSIRCLSNSQCLHFSAA